jgi:8-oxo-dGTP pyrophosphatase MutT (NUDIX family)
MTQSSNTLARESDALLSTYVQKLSDEATRLQPLTAQQPFTDRITLRTTLPGHLTASAFVLCPSTRRMLLISHKRLGRMLQPGGHVEASDASMELASAREVREETGLQVDGLAPSVRSLGLLDIDIHPIPAHAGKGEAAHDHYDYRFGFVVDAESALTPQEAEVHGCVWCDVNSDMVREAIGERCVRKVLMAMRT